MTLLCLSIDDKVPEVDVKRTRIRIDYGDSGKPSLQRGEGLPHSNGAA